MEETVTLTNQEVFNENFEEMHKESDEERILEKQGVFNSKLSDEDKIKLINSGNKYTTEEIETLLGEEGQVCEWNGEKFISNKYPPRTWKCKRCGNIYKPPIGYIPHQCECHSKDFKLEIPNMDELVEYYEFNPKVFKADVQGFLVTFDKALCTEIITTVLKSKFPFYTTRHDELAEVWTYEKGIYSPQGKTHIKQYCREILGKNYTEYLANCVVAKIETDTFIGAKQFFDNKIIHKIVCENGTINLKTKQLENWNRKEIHFQKIPITFDEKAICPEIDKFFSEVLETEEDKQAMYEFFGFCLWKDNFLEMCAMFLGPQGNTMNGGNGKSKTAELLKRFLGEENTKAISLHEMETDHFSESELYGKLANIVPDIGSKTLYDTSAFKAITGRDGLSASRKFKEKVDFVNYAKGVFGCNKLPKTTDRSRGFFRRWLPFRFPYTFETAEGIEKVRKEKGEEAIKMFKLKDPERIEKISTPQEFSGLLNKAIEGLHRLLERKQFTTSKTSDEIRTMWIKLSDSALAFSWDYLESDTEGSIPVSAVAKAYRKYCRENKLLPQPPNWFNKILNEEFGAIQSHEAEDGTTLRVWEGISFNKEKIQWISLKGDEIQ